MLLVYIGYASPDTDALHITYCRTFIFYFIVLHCFTFIVAGRVIQTDMCFLYVLGMHPWILMLY